MAELTRRAPQRGFDPSNGSTAEPHEVRPPNGACVIALYRSAGYLEVPPFNDQPFAARWFAKPVR